jgi:hypothetical protein
MQDILNVLHDEFEHGTTPIGVFVIQGQDFLAMWLAARSSVNDESRLYKKVIRIIAGRILLLYSVSTTWHIS